MAHVSLYPPQKNPFSSWECFCPLFGNYSPEPTPGQRCCEQPRASPVGTLPSAESPLSRPLGHQRPLCVRPERTSNRGIHHQRANTSWSAFSKRLQKKVCTHSAYRREHCGARCYSGLSMLFRAVSANGAFQCIKKSWQKHLVCRDLGIRRKLAGWHLLQGAAHSAQKVRIWRIH